MSRKTFTLRHTPSVDQLNEKIKSDYDDIKNKKAENIHIQRGNWSMSIAPCTSLDQKVWYCIKGIDSDPMAYTHNWLFGKYKTLKDAKIHLAMMQDPNQILHCPW